MTQSLNHMQKSHLVLFLTSIISFYSSFAQYTESINTYRPGTSQGAFSVGKKVFQAESGLDFSDEQHRIFNNNSFGTGVSYLFRYGILLEQLEISFQGKYLRKSVRELINGTPTKFIYSGMTRNIVGLKFLFYDPSKRSYRDELNIRSWNANQKFKWRNILPAISIYAGASFTSGTSDFAFHNNSDNRPSLKQPMVSPRIVLATQHNFTKKLAFVNNFILDYLNTEFPDKRYISTLTYNFKKNWAVLGEYEAASSKIYQDNIFRLGATWSMNDNTQIDISGVKNLSKTPSIISFGFGFSHRWNYHTAKDDEKIPSEKMYDIEQVAKQIKKDIKSGFLDEDTLSGKYRGVDLAEYKDEEKNDDLLEENDIPEKKNWLQRIGSKLKSKKKKGEVVDSSEEEIITLGTGNRTDFANEDFLREKRNSIKPRERTPEEIEAINTLKAEQLEKKNKRLKTPLIDPLTGEAFSDEELANMSKKEIKHLRKEQKILEELDNDLLNLEDEISGKKEYKRKEKKQKRAQKEASEPTSIFEKNSDGEPKEQSNVEEKISKEERKAIEQQKREEAALQKEIEALEKAQLKEEKALEKQRNAAEKKRRKELDKEEKPEHKNPKEKIKKEKTSKKEKVKKEKNNASDINW